MGGRALIQLFGTPGDACSLLQSQGRFSTRVLRHLHALHSLDSPLG